MVLLRVSAVSIAVVLCSIYQRSNQTLIYSTNVNLSYSMRTAEWQGHSACHSACHSLLSSHSALPLYSAYTARLRLSELANRNVRRRSCSIWLATPTTTISYEVMRKSIVSSYQGD